MTRPPSWFTAAVLAGLALLASIAALLAVPQVLESWILADRDAGGTVATLLLWLLALMLGSTAGLSWRAAGRAVRGGAAASRGTAARTAALLLIGAVVGIAVVEGLARLVLSPAALLRGDDAWIARWLAVQEAGAGTGRAEKADPLAGGGRPPMAPADPLHRHDPTLGWAPVANFRSDGLNTNSAGLRGIADVPAERPAGERRIVVLGDSFTFGDGVRDEETWVARLAAKLPKSAALNLGVLGYGTDQQYLRLKELGLALQPDLVVLGCFGPDADRNVLGFRDGAKPRFELADGTLALTNVPVPGAADLRARLAPPAIGSYALALWTVGYESARDATVFAPKWAVTRAILDAIADRCAEQQVPLLFAYFPDKWAAFRRSPDAYETQLLGWAEARGVPSTNLRAAFLELKPEQRGQLFKGHWTPFGNDFVADAVARAIQEQRLLDR